MHEFSKQEKNQLHKFFNSWRMLEPLQYTLMCFWALGFKLTLQPSLIALLTACRKGSGAFASGLSTPSGRCVLTMFTSVCLSARREQKIVWKFVNSVMRGKKIHYIKRQTNSLQAGIVDYVLYEYSRSLNISLLPLINLNVHQTWMFIKHSLVHINSVYIQGIFVTNSPYSQKSFILN